MKNKAKKIVSFSFLLFSISVFAGNEQIPKDRKITSLTIYNGTAFVLFSPGYSHSQGCPSGGTSTLAIQLDSNSNLGKDLYATALAAATAGKKVGFGISGCFSERPKIYRIDVMFD